MINEENKDSFDQEIIDVAMSIIMDAGDARLILTDCFKELAEGNYDVYEAKMEDARKLLAKAHRQQTDIIQSEIEGPVRQYPLLFSHAQDTLMTINSEMNICRQMLFICKKFEDRISALEKGDGTYE